MLLAIGILMVDALYIFTKQLDQNLTKNTKGIDLVLGAKGSPMQIILSSIFYIDFPTGNIKIYEAEKLVRNRYIKQMIPISLGDAYNGFRIVGTNHDYLTVFDAKVEQGRLWGDRELEVVIGAGVAKKLNLNLGDEFAGQHGLSGGYSHEEHGYEVVGIITPTGTAIDRLIVTSLESVWEVHEEEVLGDSITTEPKWSKIAPSVNLNSLDSLKEVTSLLIKYRSPMAAIQLPNYINGKTNMQAASPAMETARLFTIVGVGVEVLEGFAYLLVFVAMLSVFISLYNALRDRKYDLAIMRAMGASKRRLFFTVLIEGMFITFIGGVIGILLAHGTLEIVVNLYTETGMIGFSGQELYAGEMYLILAVLIIGILSALLPALGVFKVDVSKVLSEE